MRIAHLVISGDVAGGQIVALDLARAGRSAGHDVSFVSPSDGAFLDRVRTEGFAAHVIPIRGGLDAAAALNLARLVRGRVDVVHTHGHFGVNVVGRVAARIGGASVISHMHVENVFRPGRGRRLQVLVDNLTARLCSAIVAVSDATRASLEDQGYPRDRLVTIHNGIAPPAPTAPVELAPRPIVLQVARLAEVKGQRTLIAALAELPEVNAVLVGVDLEGGGAYERVLRDEAERLGVSGRVVFAGRRDDVAALLAGCDVFCLASTVEGLPIVVLEAMAAGVPVVATPVGGTAELVVDGVTGLLVPPADPAALARAIRRILGDRELARRFGDAGRARVAAGFTLARMTQRVLALYDGAPTIGP